MSDILAQGISEYLDSLSEPQNADFAAFRELCEERGIPLILRDTEAFLSLLLRLAKPAEILELGTAIGYSACAFAAAAPVARVTTLERDAEKAAEAREQVQRMAFSDRITILEGDAADLLPALAKEGLSFDFIFIDAAKGHYREYWDLCLPLAKKGGLIVCDNILFHGRTASDSYDPEGRYTSIVRRMRDFVDYLRGFEGARTEFFAIGDGTSVSEVL